MKPYAELTVRGQALGLSNFILNNPNPDWRLQAPEFIARVEKRLRILMNMNFPLSKYNPLC